MYDEKEFVAPEYTDRIMATDRDMDDEFFSEPRRFFDDDVLVELTAVMTRENSSSEFINRAGLPA